MTRDFWRIIRPSRSLGGQLTILIGLLSAIPSLVFVGLGFVAFHHHALPERRAHLAELAAEYTKRMETLLAMRLEEAADVRRDLARDRRISSGPEALAHELSEHAAFASLSLVGLDGRVLASTRRDDAGETSRYTDVVAAAVESGTSIGSLTADPSEGGLVVPMAVHAGLGTDPTRSTLLATLLWSELFSVVHDGAVHNGDGRLKRFVVFVENSGRVVATPGALLDTLSPLEVIPGLLTNNQSIEELADGATLELGGINYRVVREQRRNDTNQSSCGIERRCKTGSWSTTAIIFEDTAVALAPIRALLRREIMMAFLMILLSTLAARFFAKRLTARLSRLMHATEAIANGRAVEPVPVAGDDEIGTLTDHFNSMSVALSESRNILENHASELEETNLTLRELDEMRTHLMANVSHEMCTPIAAMVAAARIISRYHSKKPDDIPRFSKVIIDEGKRLSTLVNEALDLSMLESHEAEWRDEAIDVDKLIADTIDHTKPLAQSRDICIGYQASVDLPPLVVDPKRLRQVIQHLVDNAVTFTPSGGKVTVRSSLSDGRLCIEVADNGIGIATRDLDKIFLAFYQVQDADPHREKPEGSGLGLAICYDIVKRYGGEIKVDSTPGHGSVFRVSLPLETADSTVDTATQHA